MQTQVSVSLWKLGSSTDAEMSLSKLDLFYRRLILTKFYTRGWGTPEELKEILRVHKIISNREKCVDFVGNIKGREVHLNRDTGIKSDKYRTIDGYFESPICGIVPHLVPEKCKTAYFQLVLPAEAPKHDLGPVCIHMAGTGDHGFSRRRELLAKPLLAKGISSLILENPYYGLRKPVEQNGSGLLQVKDLFIMGLSLVLEGYWLMKWLEREGYSRLGLTGISMGGHMASLAATNWPKPIAVVPCMSWTSSSVVWTEGVLSKAIPWRTLEEEYAAKHQYDVEPMLRSSSNDMYIKDQRYDKSLKKTKEERKRKAVIFMRDVMDKVTGLQNYSVPFDPTLATFVVAKADAYYPIHKLKPMDEIWPGCEVRYLNTGHIAGFLMHHRDFCRAIVDTFDRLSLKYTMNDDMSRTTDTSISDSAAHHTISSAKLEAPLPLTTFLRSLQVYTNKS